MRSIRAYLLSRLLGGSALVLAAAGAAVYVAVARSLERQFDRALADRVQAFASILFQVEDHVELEFSQELMPEYEPGPRAAYFEIRFADGRLLERSPSLAGAQIDVPVAVTTSPAHWTAKLPDGRAGRHVARLVTVHHVHPEEGPDRPQAAVVRIVVACGREELQAAESQVLFGCVAVGCSVLALIALLARSAVARGLEPAGRLAATLDAIRMEALPAALDAGPLPRELEPVSSKADALIRRVDTALRRERRTTADIAHELRTPISEILTVSEVALRDGQDPSAARRALATARDVAGRMGRSVATLLKLARLDMGAEAFEHEAVEIDALVAECLRSLGTLAQERGIRVENRIEAGARIAGDREALRIVVSNLLGNALYESPARATVTCELQESGSAWRLCVRNAAPQLAPEDLASLTDPFWRKDSARSDRSRSGLGLALSRALAEKSGMRLEFALADGVLSAVVRSQAPPPTVRGTSSSSRPEGDAQPGSSVNGSG